MKRTAPAIVIILILSGHFFCSSAPVSWVRAKSVLDGDTIVLSDGRHLRYIGINAPEIEHDQTPGEAFGPEALALNRQLVFGQRIRMEWDLERKDRYGRSLAYVFRKDGVFINQALVEQGLAHVLRHNPNLRYSQRLLEAQREAMSTRKGMWRYLANSGKGHFFGNRQSRRFHTIHCPEARKINGANRVAFDSAWDAFWQGYAPAKGCITGIAVLLNLSDVGKKSNPRIKKGDTTAAAENPP